MKTQLSTLWYQLLVRNLKVKICFALLQMGLLYQYCQTVTFSKQINIFNTFPANSPYFIFQNLNWFLYYLVPLVTTIPVFKEFLLKQNVFVWIRKSDDQLPLLAVGLMGIMNAVLYNLYFWGFIWLFESDSASLSFISELALATTLSLFASTILVLLLNMLLRGIVGELLTIVLFLTILALKINWLILITTPGNFLTLSAWLSLWIIGLGGLLGLVYRQVELL